MPEDLFLSDGTVTLRFVTGDDVAAHCEAVNESVAEVGKWLTWCHADYTPEESAVWIAAQPEARQNGQAYEFGIFDAQSGRFLGCCGINYIGAHSRIANLGYWVRTSAAGRDVCTAASRLAVQFAFAQLDLQRIEIVAAAQNIPSNRVAQKLGALKEADLRRRFMVDGEPQSGVLYSLTPDDWPDA